MSNAAKMFGEAYRDKPLLVEKKSGVEHLVPGQHEAIWADDGSGKRDYIELSYVTGTGHSFVVVHLEKQSLQPVAMHTAELGGIREINVPPGWTLSEAMMAAVTKLKMQEAHLEVPD